jgi:hypothetical protein
LAQQPRSGADGSRVITGESELIAMRNGITKPLLDEGELSRHAISDLPECGV